MNTQFKITISMSEKDMKLIKNFCRKNSINLSARTVQLWKQLIEQSKE